MVGSCARSEPNILQLQFLIFRFVLFSLGSCALARHFRCPSPASFVAVPGRALRWARERERARASERKTNSKGRQFCCEFNGFDIAIGGGVKNALFRRKSRANNVSAPNAERNEEQSSERNGRANELRLFGDASRREKCAFCMQF